MRSILTNIALSIGVYFLSVSTSVIAQDLSHTKTASLLDMPFEELLNLNVTVASKVEEKQSEAPSTVTVFTKEEIRRMGVNTLEELLNYVPNFQGVRSQLNPAQQYAVTARGFGDSQLSPDILFLIDGKRLNNFFWGSAQLFNGLISLHNVERIEIIRGPGSALYGANAFIGVVNVITNKSDNRIYAAGGNLNRREGSAQFSRSYEKWDFSVSMAGFNDEGETFPEVIKRDGSTVKDPMRGLDFMTSAEYDQKHTISYAHTNREYRDFYVFNSQSPTNYMEAWVDWIQFKSNFYKDNKWDVSLTSSYQHSKGVGRIMALPASVMQSLHAAGITEGTEPFFVGPIWLSNETDAELGVHYTVSPDHIISGGVGVLVQQAEKGRNVGNYEDEDVINVAVLGKPGIIRYYGDMRETTLFVAERSRTNFNAYLQDKYSFTKRLKSTVGVRFDRYSDFGSSVNPRFALTYAAQTDTTFKFMYGQAFRAPTNQEQTSMNNPVGYGNPDVQPEQVKTTEVGLIQKFKFMETGITFFHSKVSDSIKQIAGQPGDILLSFQNVGEITAQGLEFETQVMPCRYLSLRGTFSHNFGSPEDPAIIPTNLASFIINAEYGKFNANLNGHWHDEVIAAKNTTETLDSYMVTNLNLRYKLTPFLRLVATGKNIFDQTYFTPDTGGPLRSGVPNRGRTYLLGVEMDF